jgi:hypothetical protein
MDKKINAEVGERNIKKQKCLGEDAAAELHIQLLFPQHLIGWPSDPIRRGLPAGEEV